MAKMPSCRKCGSPHYNFVSCASAPAFNERQENKPLTDVRYRVRGNEYKPGVESTKYAVVGNVYYRKDPPDGPKAA